MAEHWSPKPGVAGASPARRAIFLIENTFDPKQFFRQASTLAGVAELQGMEVKATDKPGIDYWARTRPLSVPMSHNSKLYTHLRITVWAYRRTGSPIGTSTTYNRVLVTVRVGREEDGRFLFNTSATRRKTVSATTDQDLAVAVNDAINRAQQIDGTPDLSAAVRRLRVRGFRPV